MDKSTDFLVRCSSCAALNRVSKENMGKRGLCGGCGSEFAALGCEAGSVDDASWAREVTGSKLPTVVKAWSPTCSVCLRYAPEFSRIARSLCPDARALKINVAENPAIASRYGISAVPALMLFEDGQLVTTLMGPQPESSIRLGLGL